MNSSNHKNTHAIKMISRIFAIAAACCMAFNVSLISVFSEDGTDAVVLASEDESSNENEDDDVNTDDEDYADDTDDNEAIYDTEDTYDNNDADENEDTDDDENNVAIAEVSVTSAVNAANSPTANFNVGGGEAGASWTGGTVYLCGIFSESDLKEASSLIVRINTFANSLKVKVNEARPDGGTVEKESDSGVIEITSDMIKSIGYSSFYNVSLKIEGEVDINGDSLTGTLTLVLPDEDDSTADKGATSDNTNDTSNAESNDSGSTYGILPPHAITTGAAVLSAGEAFYSSLISELKAQQIDVSAEVDGNIITFRINEIRALKSVSIYCLNENGESVFLKKFKPDEVLEIDVTDYPELDGMDRITFVVKCSLTSGAIRLSSNKITVEL